MSEIGTSLKHLPNTEQAPEKTGDLAGPAESDAVELVAPALESEPARAAEPQWNNATEEEWNEHSATSWALAYVIHRIRSTPHPPILLSEQRRHFEKVVEMAAALIEQWQGHERDLAQQLGMRRPVTALPEESPGADQAQLQGSDNEADDDWIKPAYTRPYQLLPDDDETPPADASNGPEAPVVEDDYQI